MYSETSLRGHDSGAVLRTLTFGSLVSGLMRGTEEDPNSPPRPPQFDESLHLVAGEGLVSRSRTLRVPGLTGR